MRGHPGYKNQYINSLCDDIIFDIPTPPQMNEILYPSMAGTTNPDPDYYIHRKQDHAYKHLYVLEYVLSGKGHIESGNRKYTVQAGDFYILNRYTLPQYRSDPADPFCKIWVNISGRFINALAYTYQITEPVLVVHDPSLETYIRQLHAELTKYPADEIHAGYDRMMAILLELFQKISYTRNHLPTIQKNATFSQITEYISENILLEKMDVDYICTYFYMSYSTLYRMCMDHVGLSPNHYILKLKIDYAKNMLTSTNCSVAKVAEALNFSSPLYFCQVFKKYTGVTPTNWKSQEKIIDVSSTRVKDVGTLCQPLVQELF